MARAATWPRVALALVAGVAAWPASASERDAAGGADPAADDRAGVAFGAVYTGERWSAMDGGRATGGAYVDNLGLTGEVDGERAFGVPGLTLFAHVLYHHGREFGGRYPAAAQGISSIEAVRAWRLYEAWTDWRAGAGSVRVGLYDLSSEFDVNETGALFVNPAHGTGSEFAQSGANGPSIFPVASVAVRYRRAARGWRWQLAALDGVPGDPDDPASNRVRFDAGDGALVVGEASRESGRARVLLGAWYYTARFDDVRDVDANGAPVRRRGASGAYGLVEGRPFVASGAAPGLSVFLRAGVADRRVHRFGSYLGAGAVYTGAFPGRPADRLGLALASAANGARFRDARARAGTPVERRETIWELAYRLQLREDLYVQPDVQYVANPSTDPTLRNAWVLGLRFQAAWRRR